MVETQVWKVHTERFPRSPHPHSWLVTCGARPLAQSRAHTNPHSHTATNKRKSREREERRARLDRYRCADGRRARRADPGPIIHVRSTFVRSSGQRERERERETGNSESARGEGESMQPPHHTEQENEDIKNKKERQGRERESRLSVSCANIDKEEGKGNKLG
jgi:hypothetical protein